MAEFVRVGQIVGAFGLKGHLKIDPLTDFEDRFAEGSRLRLDGEWVTVRSMKVHKGRPLVRLDGVNDLTSAEKLKWLYLEAPAKDEEELDDDEYLVEDLIDMNVVTMTGEELGKVEDVLPYPAQDVLKIGDLLIPMVKEFVKDVDLKHNVIRVQLLPGMMSEEPQ